MHTNMYICIEYLQIYIYVYIYIYIQSVVATDMSNFSSSFEATIAHLRDIYSNLNKISKESGP